MEKAKSFIFFGIKVVAAIALVQFITRFLPPTVKQYVSAYTGLNITS